MGWGRHVTTTPWNYGMGKKHMELWDGGGSCDHNPMYLWGHKPMELWDGETINPWNYGMGGGVI